MRYKCMPYHTLIFLLLDRKISLETSLHTYVHHLYLYTWEFTWQKRKKSKRYIITISYCLGIIITILCTTRSPLLHSNQPDQTQSPTKLWVFENGSLLGYHDHHCHHRKKASAIVKSNIILFFFLFHLCFCSVCHRYYTTHYILINGTLSANSPLYLEYSITYRLFCTHDIAFLYFLPTVTSYIYVAPL